VAQENTLQTTRETGSASLKKVSDAGLKPSAPVEAIVVGDHIRLISGPAPSPGDGRCIESSSRFVDWGRLITLCRDDDCKLEKFGETHAKS